MFFNFFKDGVVLQLTRCDEEIHTCFHGKIKKENVRNDFVCKKVFSFLAHGKAISHTRIFTKLYISRERIEMHIYILNKPKRDLFQIKHIIKKANVEYSIL